MRPTIVSIVATLALAAGVSVAYAKTVVRFPYKGAPHAVQVPDRQSTTSLENSKKSDTVKPEQHNGVTKNNQPR